MNKFKRVMKCLEISINQNEQLAKIMSLARKKGMKIRLLDFAEESNSIEGIFGEEHADNHAIRLEELLLLDELTIADLSTFNTAGHIRLNSWHNVQVGDHVPPPGGQAIIYALDDILVGVNDGQDPVDMHHQFETLHPYMDGNGRTGRAIWLWQMVNQFDYNIGLGFLHMWYYQSLERDR